MGIGMVMWKKICITTVIAVIMAIKTTSLALGFLFSKIMKKGTMVYMIRRRLVIMYLAPPKKMVLAAMVAGIRTNMQTAAAMVLFFRALSSGWP